MEILNAKAVSRVQYSLTNFHGCDHPPTGKRWTAKRMDRFLECSGQPGFPCNGLGCSFQDSFVGTGAPVP